MNARIPLALVAAALVALTGCLNGSPEPQDPVPPVDPLGYGYYLKEFLPVDLDHDHTDPVLHTASFQIDFAGYHACTADGKQTSSSPRGFTDIAFHENHAFVGNGHGFCVLDVTDPTKPVFLSQYQGEPSADLEVTADGNFVLLLTQRNALPRNPQSNDPTDHFPRGAILVNVKDKKNPQFESYYPVPTNGVHTAVTYLMGTRQLVSIQTYDWVPPSVPGAVPPAIPTQNPPYTQRVEITELKPTPAGRMALERLATWSLPRPATEPLVHYFPHDAYIEKHPLDGKTYLYVAYWDAGLVILDITNPANPQLVSQFNDKKPSNYNQYHDVKVSNVLIAGRHITVTGPELQSASGDVGYFRIMDTTDPKKPIQLGAWTLPGVQGFSGGFLFSPHVFQVIDGRIYLAHNHGGIWVLDIHNETLLRDPKPAGYYFPHGDERDSNSWGRSASVWGAYFHEGYVYATEGSQGVHVLQWVGDATGNATNGSRP